MGNESHDHFLAAPVDPNAYKFADITGDGMEPFGLNSYPETTPPTPEDLQRRDIMVALRTELMKYS